MPNEHEELAGRRMSRKMISLTEWLEQIGHGDTVAHRSEDNAKRERLQVLFETIGLQTDTPHRFSATDIAEKTQIFQDFFAKHGNELCALRLLPRDPKLPKLRMRGFTVKDVVENWFVDQHIDPAMYQAEFIPHTESQLWSSIFVVNEKGIFGDLIRGGLFQLSQGYYKENTLISFSYDFSQWKISENDSEAAEYLKQLIEKLKVNDESTKQILKEKLNATFAHDYLKGYFETSDSVEFGLWFVDYNRLLGDLYNDFSTTTDSGTHAAQAKEGTLHGKAGNNGTAKGEVRIILDPLDYKGDFPEGAILVCHMTTPEYLPFMQKAGAIITEVGGILSHAVVVARELKKPCLIGVKDAAEILKDGEKIEVDANKGIVSIL